jgi:hypothetical protein
MEEKEKKNEPTTFTSFIKKNINIILMILVVVIIISIINMNSYIICKPMKGGIGQIASQSVQIFTNLTRGCRSNLFEEGIQRFKFIMENIMSVLAIIIAIFLIPSFPIFLYVAAMYLIFSQMFKGMRLI